MFILLRISSLVILSVDGGFKGLRYMNISKDFTLYNEVIYIDHACTPSDKIK